jgi:hypothetical protein
VLTHHDLSTSPSLPVFPMAQPPQVCPIAADDDPQPVGESPVALRFVVRPDENPTGGGSAPLLHSVRSLFFPDGGDTACVSAHWPRVAVFCLPPEDGGAGGEHRPQFPDEDGDKAGKCALALPDEPGDKGSHVHLLISGGAPVSLCQTRKGGDPC